MEIHLRRGDPQAAIEHDAQAVALQPDSVHFRHGYAWALDLTGAVAQATEAFAEVVRLQPDHKEALLRQAARAFIDEQRWDGALWSHRLDAAAGLSPVRAAPWEGEAIEDESLLVLGEQGVGDQIMFAGLVRRAEQAAGSVTVECEERLIPLFRRSFGDLDLVPWSHPADTAVSERRFDRKLPMADLIGLGPAAPRDAYLRSDPGLTAALARKYRSAVAPFVVGVSWQSGNAGNGPFRSLPLDRWGPVLKADGCAFVDLQYGDHDAELQAVQEATGVAIRHDPDVDPLKDLDAFAAQVAAMDAVVTVDNSTVHMAGALGIPTVLMLPVAADWRWLRRGTETQWYRSVTLVRQTQFGQWEDVIAGAAEELSRIRSRVA